MDPSAQMSADACHRPLGAHAEVLRNLAHFHARTDLQHCVELTGHALKKGGVPQLTRL